MINIGSQVYLTADPTQQVGVILAHTEKDFVVQYNDRREVYELDVPLTVVGFSDPALWHPAANVVELLPRVELFEMAKDIKENGQQVAIVLFEGKILDGRNRLLACNLVGIEPTFTTLDAVDDPAKYVVSMNVMRRQMTPGQKATHAVLLKDFYKAQAAENMLAGKGIDPSSKMSGGKVDKHVAEKIGVSNGYVHKAQKIKDKSEELFERVKSGELTIPEAEQILNPPSEDAQPTEQTVTVTFLHKHLKAFRQFAKENQIVWDSN